MPLFLADAMRQSRTTILPFTSAPSLADRAPVHLVRGAILQDVRRIALSLNVDPIALLKRAGIDRRHVDNPDLLLPARSIVEVFELGSLVCGVEDFGLRVGESRGLPDFGPVLLMLREAPTLREALRTLITFLHLHTEAVYMHLQEGELPALTLEIMTGSSQCGQVIDSGMAGITHILRWLLGEKWSPQAVCFAHAQPLARVRYERFFHCPVGFMQDTNSIILQPHDLDKKLAGASPALRRQIERMVQELNLAPTDTYVHRVTQIIAMMLPRGEAHADLVARYLGTDRRTLNRRLARSGLNHSALLQRLRLELVQRYLLGSDRTLSNVATLVGFASLSAFTQWFRRTYRCAPSAWRRKQRQAPAVPRK